MRKLLPAVCVLLCSAWLAGLAVAQSFPPNPIKIIVPFPAGGTTDILARHVAQGLGQKLGTSVIVENRAGASGTIGSDQVAKSPADGSVMLLTATHHVINPSLYKKLPYQTQKDFAPVALIASVPNALVVHPSVPAKTVGELIALAKKEPGKLSYGSAGVGGANHLAGELFKLLTGVDIVHVPYKGAAPALTDVIAGHVQLMFATAASVVPHIQSGKVRALAVTTPKRTAVFPELATVDELGLKGFDATTWHGLVAPAKTPKDVVAKLHKATVEALHDEQVRKSLVDLGVDIVGNSPEEFAAYIKAEIPKWTKIVQASGAKLD